METIENRIITKLFRVNTETKEFIGFYDSEIHNLQPDGVEYFELSEENWQALLDKQSEGEEIRILNQFDFNPMLKAEFTPQIGTYQVPPIPEGMVKAVFNYKDEVWEETATREEEVYNLRNKANVELSETDKFEDGAYRRRLTDIEKTEIDSYRDELLNIVETCNSELYTSSEGMMNLSLVSLPTIPDRPVFTKQYDR